MTSTMKLRTVVAGTLALGVLGSSAALAPSAFASHGGSGVRANGACSSQGTWQLKAKHDNSVIEVEGEVDTNHAGQHFAWRLVDNGTRVAKGTAVTVAPSGSFTVHRNIANRAGTDTITFRAVNTANGNTCTGSVSL
jgi:hypothetical protein